MSGYQTLSRALLYTPMCLPCACNHQKRDCLMNRVCLGNSQISPIDVAQLGRQVVQISKTAHTIAKLVTPMCLPCACNHQKSNCLMIRVCLGNGQISPIDVAELGRQLVQISKTAHPIVKLVTPMCLPCACNHQKSNCLMNRVCLGNSQISPIDHRCSWIGQTSGSNLQNRSSSSSSYCKTSYTNVFSCACNHQKSNCLMIRVCLGNNQISPIDVAQWADKWFKSPKPLILLQN